MIRFLLHALVSAALFVLCGTASAQFMVRAGATYIAPNSSASDAVGPFLPGPPSGISVDVQNQATLFLSLAYEINPNMEVELVGGYPPTHDVNAKIAPFMQGTLAGVDGQTLARVRQVAPTLFFNYKFGDAGSQWRPFVGIGVNYTNFDKRVSTAANNALNGGPTDMSLTDSWGLAGQVGVSYNINDRWSVIGSVATAQVKTKLTTTTAGVQRSMDISFHPAVLTIAAGYRF